MSPDFFQTSTVVKARSLTRQRGAGISIRTKLLLILLAFIVIPMTIAGGLGFIIAKRSLEQSRVQGLESTADLKVKKIEDFFRERRGDLATIRTDATLLQNLPILAQYYNDPENPEYQKARARLDHRLVPFSQAY